MTKSKRPVGHRDFIAAKRKLVIMSLRDGEKMRFADIGMVMNISAARAYGLYVIACRRSGKYWDEVTALEEKFTPEKVRGDEA